MNIERFKTFLIASGAEIMEPTNQYEVVRFKTKNGVSVVYTGKRGFSFTGEAEEAYTAMLKTNAWRIEPDGAKKKKRTKAAVIHRDGTACFFCGQETTEENRTIEHLLAIANGGNNHPANLVIACQPCNAAVDKMMIVEKVKFREKMRTQWTAKESNDGKRN